MLGPTLFSIYTEGFPLQPKNMITTYVDDTVIIFKYEPSDI